MRSPQFANRLLAKIFDRDRTSSLRNGELPHTRVMDAEQRACKVVADNVLSIEDAAERAAFTRQLIAYSIASLVVLEGDKAAAEFTYAAADATVGMQ